MTDRIVILGSTGSVGCNTLDVVRLHPESYQVAALAANENVTRMLDQCVEFLPERVVMVDANAASDLRAALSDLGLKVDVECGAKALDNLIHSDIATVFAPSWALLVYLLPWRLFGLVRVFWLRTRNR